MAQFPEGSNDVGVAMLNSELVNFRNELDSALNDLNDLNELDNAPNDQESSVPDITKSGLTIYSAQTKLVYTLHIPYILPIVILRMILCMVAWECNRFEDLDCSPGDEEEHHELSPSLKERKERAPGRARGILYSKIWSHKLLSLRNKPTNESTKHHDNEVHDAKLKTQSGRARSKALSPKVLLLTLVSILITWLAALGHKKRLSGYLLMATIITVVSGRAIPPENSETRKSPTFSSDPNPLQSLIDKFELLKNWGIEAAIALAEIAACEIIRIFCKKVQHRLLSATCMVTSTCSFAYFRGREDTTVGLLAGVSFAGVVFTWNTFSLGVGKHNFDTSYVPPVLIDVHG
ncbi:hypothetical protein BOTNAR_0570g00080 [Botryotinia narcissicola]|uniref:Uncharacterized protein n=1 Tax=Botryotinia narcissicola TaxID=278944 RepID=A0A4Z1HP72_9HELO|nr:hypothetical protein BOTNAR_0570g00080 [Botryotinia narcissicola]